MAAKGNEISGQSVTYLEFCLTEAKTKQREEEEAEEEAAAEEAIENPNKILAVFMHSEERNPLLSPNEDPGWGFKNVDFGAPGGLGHAWAAFPVSTGYVPPLGASHWGRNQ